MTAKLKSFTLASSDLPFLLDQVNAATIKIVSYDLTGVPIYGYADSSGVIHQLGTLGSFDPLNPSIYVNTTNYVLNARDPLGLRNVNGVFNNLTAPNTYTWGSANDPFIRLTNSDYSHYVSQNTNNAAFNPYKNPFSTTPVGFQNYYQTAANGQVIDPSTNTADSSALYANPFKTVVDYTPRMISQTVTSQSALDSLGITTDVDSNGTPFVRNINTVAGDPSFSGWFVLFGQFFDHGLDFIDKGGNNGAKIVIPLAPTDPLYDPTHGVTSMTISRATVSNQQAAGADGKFRTADDVIDVGADGQYGTADDLHGLVNPTYKNTDSPYIDQNQTYGSDDQIAMLLREWVEDPNNPGHYIPGAKLFDGTTLATSWNLVKADGTSVQTHQTLPTLNELRAYLAQTGRDDLTWEDVLNYRARDAEGHVLDYDPNTAGVQAIHVGQAVLLDMNPHFDAAHIYKDGANPDSTGPLAGFVLDAPNQYSMGLPANLANYIDFTTFSIKTGLSATDQAIANELLLRAVGDHYIAGDGRANENFGLTSLHHVFHENHNWQVDNVEYNILQQQANDPTKTYAHSWQVAVTAKTGDVLGAGVVNVAGHYEDANGNYVDKTGTVSWNQEKVFQSGLLINQMEYQHVAIDQYARFITPDLPEFVTYDSGINADISLEYGQAAFRFGHSQLRETIDFLDPNGSLTGAVQHYALEQAFLNPQGFAQIGPTAIALGMTRQVGNETDEFVTPALQQTLLGQPLDLAAINIARGRDLGLPTLNEARKQIHDALAAERASGSKAHINLIVDSLNPYVSWNDFANNMIHPESLANFIAAYSFDGDVAKGNAIVGLENGTIAEGSAEAQGYTVQNAIEFLNNFGTHADEGFNKIDLWIGGLAEKHVYTGQLGTTFNAIFEDQMERLMDGDRFYYLYRLDGGLALTTQLNNMIVTEQFKDIIERTTGARHLNGDVMTYADSYVELGETPSDNGTGTARKTEHKYGDLAANLQIGVRSTSGNSTAANGVVITLNGQQYIFDARPDIGENPDGTPSGGYNSHEVIAGTDYNDYIDAGDGDDTIYGGAGNDILDGKAGADHIYGEDGNDIIYGGDIDDFLDGGNGDDTIYAGTSAGALDVVIGGAGNDHLYGEAGIDELYGGTGDDYIDAGGDTDLAFGGEGNDEIYGGDGPDALHGEFGDDIISGGSAADVLFGEGGDDILLGGIGGGAFQGDADECIGGDGFNMVSYTDATIVLDVAADLNQQNIVAAPGVPATTPFGQLWIDISGVIGSKFSDTFIGDANNNWLIGGSSNDTFTGGAGNDLIVGDSIRLDVLDGTYNGNTLQSNGLLDAGGQGGAKHFVDLLKSRPNFVLGDGNTSGTTDMAVFSGKREDYTVTKIDFTDPHGNGVTAYKIVDNGSATRPASDGTDLLVGIEQFKFADGVLSEASILFVNHAPAIASNGGGDTAVLTTPENTTAVLTTVQATDPDPGQVVTYGIATTTGTDFNLFSINATTGALSFNTAPNFELPWKAGNSYLVDVTATDPYGAIDTQRLTVNVTNVNETGGVNVNYAIAANQASATLTAVPFDPDGISATPATTYQWQVSTNGGASYSNIPQSVTGSRSASFTPSGTYVGNSNATLQVVATYTDPFGSQTVTSQSVQVGTIQNNTLNGTAGADILIGLNGNDTYTVNNINDQVVENAGGGTDTVNASVTYTLAANVENLTLTGTANINGTGNALDNILTGNSGNNVLAGGAGNDTYDVQNLGDSVVENLNEGTDVVQSSVTWTLGDNIENLTLTGTANINGTGNALNNVLTGNSGNNTLDGGAGADTMTGAAGNDIYVVDNNADQVIENLNGGTDTVQSSITWTLGNNIENLILTGTGNIDGTGNNLNNILTGNSGNNILDGGLGNDTMMGGAGNDTYVVQNVSDSVVENLNEGIDSVQSSITWTLGDNIENLTLTGITAINGTGNALDNVLTGNSGNNTLSGGNGNDTLLGGAGNDTLLGGGNGNNGVGTVDVLTGGANNDTFVLGQNGQTFYDDGIINSTNFGTSDYARISDFTAGDIIQLVGSAINYTLVNSITVGGQTGIGLYRNNNGAATASTVYANLTAGSIGGNDDLIALLQPTAANSALNLTSASFAYVL